MEKIVHDYNHVLGNSALKPKSAVATHTYKDIKKLPQIIRDYKLLKHLINERKLDVYKAMFIYKCKNLMNKDHRNNILHLF